MNNGFDKRIYTPGLWIGDTLFLLRNLPALIGVMRNTDISRAFMEKIMLVVTAVNGCVYCAWFHAKTALSSGLSQEELKNTVNLQFQADASDFEITALLYAQHYAETNRRPDPDMSRRLVAFYGDQTARHIKLIIRMIFFGNLAGNTFDAFISRLRGVKAPHSNALFEVIFFVLHAPVLLPLLPIMRQDRQSSRQDRDTFRHLK